MSGRYAVQVGGAVQHNPLPPLNAFHEPPLHEETGDKESSASHYSVLGGFIGNGQLSWRAIGPTIEVLDPFTCTRLAAWTFGALLHNSSAEITCVCGIGVGTVSHVAVGIDLGSDRNPRGMVGILSLRRSRITRAFHFSHKVCNVCMITNGDKLVDPCTLAPELRPCKGLLAVATGHASLYLVDIAFDLGADEITSDEVSPASFIDISVPDSNADVRRRDAVSRGYHSILQLSETFTSGGVFQLLGPDDKILYEAPSHTVQITSLMYIPQLASLIVGYSFGSFQMINLSLITIDCTSPCEENLPPVFACAYQEPENDPRSFVYLWICRSWSSETAGNIRGVSDRNAPDGASCTLYAMSYDKKEWIEGHGLWYQGLQSVSPRFEFDASSRIGKQLHSTLPAKLFAAMTVVGMTPVSSASLPISHGAADILISSDEESDPVPELSLCMFCWQGSFLDQGREVTQHYVTIFDINQWYQAQMPGHLRIEDDRPCPYMSFHIMDKVPKSLNEKLLSAAPKMGSWSRHSSKSFCDNDWYPSSLSYELHLLTSEGLVTYRCPSVQQSAISSLLQQGPGSIVDSNTAFRTCLFAGILPSDITNSGSGLSAVTEREHLLNVALEYHLLSLILQCIVEFSEGRFSHVGCSLQFLLEWAWNKVRSIKESYNTLCIPLFSPDCEAVLNDAAVATLHQNLTSLSHLHTIIGCIRDNSGEITTIGAGELEGRVQVAHLLHMHLQAILWLYHCGLLPQCGTDDQLDGKSVPFPAQSLQKIYDKRRSEIKKLNPSFTTSGLLLIDCLMEECGPLLAEIWEKDGPSNSCALYPPPNLHSLLSMYLLPGMSTAMKHRIIQYLFLDLASLLSDNYLSIVEELVKFPSSVSLSPSIIKLTQAFWLIDQKDFETGLSVLLDPLVDPNDITLEQHRRIIKTFLYQGEEGRALTYIQLRHPPEMDLEDIHINLMVLLANGRIREAFHYQRKRRVTSNAKGLLQHFFLGCEQLGRLESIVHLPLSPMEEVTFINYLRASSHPAAHDILLVYYLQQSRYSEISGLHDGIKNCNTSMRQATRNALVHGYLSHLPDVRTNLNSLQKPETSRTFYTKPQPLSARIRQSASVYSTPVSKSTLLRHNVDERDGNTSPKCRTVSYTPFRSKAQRRKAINEWTGEVGIIMNKSLKAESESQRDASRIVFPKLQEELPHQSTVSPVQPLLRDTSLYARSDAESTVASLKEDISKVMEQMLKKALNVSVAVDTFNKSLKISNDVVSLLKTPPVLKRKSLGRPSAADSLPETPQSILKVRKILQSSQNSSQEPESSVPTFPLYRSAAKLISDIKSSEKSLNASHNSSLTPKQLRFDLPMQQPSVDDSSMTVNKNIKALSKSIESDKKRKRSDHSASDSDNIPTPRKPLPGFIGKDVQIPYGLSASSESEDESEPTPLKVFVSSRNSPETLVSEFSAEFSETNKTVSDAEDNSRIYARAQEENEPVTVNVKSRSSLNDNESISDNADSASVVEPNEKTPRSSDSSKFINNAQVSDSLLDNTLAGSVSKCNVQRKSLESYQVEKRVVKNFMNEIFGLEENENDLRRFEELSANVTERGHEAQREENTLISDQNNYDISSTAAQTSPAQSVLEESFYSVFEDNSKLSVDSTESVRPEDVISNFENVNEEEEVSVLSKKISESVSHRVMEFTKSVEERCRKVSEAVAMHVSSAPLVTLESDVENSVDPNGKEINSISNLMSSETLGSVVVEEAHNDSFDKAGSLELMTDTPENVDDIAQTYKADSDEEQPLVGDILDNEQITVLIERENDGLHSTRTSLSEFTAVEAIEGDAIFDDLETSYVLKFSESEDDDECTEVKSISRASTVLIEASSQVTNSSSTDAEAGDKVIKPVEYPSSLSNERSTPPALLTEPTQQLVSNINGHVDLSGYTDTKTHTQNLPSRRKPESDRMSVLPSLPSEFAQLPAVYLTARENQVIQSVLNDSDSLLTEIDVGKQQKSRNFKKFQISSADISTVPILEFSDEDEEEDVSEQADNGEKIMEDRICAVMASKEETNITSDKMEEHSNNNGMSAASHTVPEALETSQYIVVGSENIKHSSEGGTMETNPNNNNISKIQTSKVEGTCTPRRSRRLSGIDNSVIIEDVNLLSSPVTPSLRRSRRLSSSTPTKNYETPKRKLSIASESSEMDVNESHSPLCDVFPTEVTKSGHKINMLTTGTFEAEDEICRRTPPFELSSLPLKITEKDASYHEASHLHKKLRERTSDTTQRMDTPRRRSSRLNGSTETLLTITEETQDSISHAVKTPTITDGIKRTPRKSRRKSIGQNDTVLQTIREDSELSNASERVDVHCPPNDLSPLIASGTPTVQSVRREGSCEPENLSDSVTGAPKHSLSRKETPKKCNAVVQVSKQQNVTEERGTTEVDEAPVARRTRRTSESSNASEVGVVNEAPVARRTRRASASSNASEVAVVDEAPVARRTRRTSESSNVSEVGVVNEAPVARRTRRASASSNASEVAVVDEAPVARKTRRASTSSDASEGSSEKILDITNENKESCHADSNCGETQLKYKLISPFEGETTFAEWQLNLRSSIKAKKLQRQSLSRKKSLMTMSFPDDSDLREEESNGGAGGARTKTTFIPSSVTVVERQNMKEEEELQNTIDSISQDPVVNRPPEAHQPPGETVSPQNEETRSLDFMYKFLEAPKSSYQQSLQLEFGMLRGKRGQKRGTYRRKRIVSLTAPTEEETGDVENAPPKKQKKYLTSSKKISRSVKRPEIIIPKEVLEDTSEKLATTDTGGKIQELEMPLLVGNEPGVDVPPPDRQRKAATRKSNRKR